MTTMPSSLGVVGYWLFGRTEHRVRAREHLSVVASLGRIPLGSADLRRRLEIAAWRRDEGGARFGSLFIYSPLAFVVWLPLIGVIIFGGARLATFLTALMFTFCTMVLWRTLLHRVLFARMLVPLVALVAAFGWWAAYNSESGLVISPAIARFSALLLVFGSLPGVIWFYRRWRRAAREQAHAYDALAIAAVHVVDAIHGERLLWRHSRKVRRWCEKLENLAVEATACLALKERVDPLDTGLRRELRDEALRVAEAIRLHKRALVTASCVEDVERVIESLIYGIDALVCDDRAALLVNAPDLPSRTSRLRAMVTRLIPGAVLIGIAAALPLIPGIPPTAETSARWVLLLVGASSILSSSPDTAGHVRDVLGKLLLR
ncbi:hypothetical protein [Streptomyces sp. NPDC051994]|uniref:hypothetical protein n=1 Tax=unclassified Streptomyces TaxID=2593676 RepID=UPI00342443EB